MSTPSEFDPAALSREIAHLESELARLEIGRTSLAKMVAWLSRRNRYLQLAKAFRGPATSIAAYPLLVLATGPLALGVVAFILLNLLFGFWSLSWLGFLIVSVTALVAFALLLYSPSNAMLPFETSEMEAKLGVEAARLKETVASVTELKARLATLHEHRRALAKSDQLQRAMLLQRNWKSLRSSEWEDYVVEICRTLGANVQRAEKSGVAPAVPQAPASGARGVIRREPTTLFVTFSPRRIAVAAVSEVNPFHAAAVRQVIDDLAQKGCDELGIITNARLTAGSKEYARSRRCTLVGEDEFPDFVLGKIPL